MPLSRQEEAVVRKLGVELAKNIQYATASWFVDSWVLQPGSLTVHLNPDQMQILRNISWEEASDVQAQAPASEASAEG